MTPDASEAARREALISMAEATRRLSDVVATTAVPPAVLEEAERAVRLAVAALDAAHSDDRYSGLMDSVDYGDASRTLPLSPIIGAYSPVRPEVEIWVADGRVRGRAVLGRKHVGPPGCAHGGIGALIADQLIAIVPWTLELAAITKSLSLRYRRPLPLGVELALEAWGEREGDQVVARGTISSPDGVCIEIEAELVSRARMR